MGAMILAASSRLDQLWSKCTPSNVLGWLAKTPVRAACCCTGLWALGAGTGCWVLHWVLGLSPPALIACCRCCCCLLPAACSLLPAACSLLLLHRVLGQGLRALRTRVVAQAWHRRAAQGLGAVGMHPAEGW